MNDVGLFTDEPDEVALPLLNTSDNKPPGLRPEDFHLPSGVKLTAEDLGIDLDYMPDLTSRAAFDAAVEELTPQLEAMLTDQETGEDRTPLSRKDAKDVAREVLMAHMADTSPQQGLTAPALLLNQLILEGKANTSAAWAKLEEVHRAHQERVRAAANDAEAPMPAAHDTAALKRMVAGAVLGFVLVGIVLGWTAAFVVFIALALAAMYYPTWWPIVRTKWQALTAARPAASQEPQGAQAPADEEGR